MPQPKTQDEVIATVKRLIFENLGVKIEEIRLDASFTDDLGADSLDIIELIMAAEKEFDIEIPDEDAEKISTVQEAVNDIMNRVS
jgi:acyl carrier protein